MRLLVTGGAGFMGSNFVRYILEKYPDYKVINLDKLTYAGNLENLADIDKDPKKKERYQFVKGDIAKKEDLEKALAAAGGKVDVIVNYAAETHVDQSIMNPKVFIEANVLGVQELLEMVKSGKAKKMIQISTDEVFGEIEDGEFTERSPFEPNSPYSASKAGGDLMCRAYWKTFETPVIVTHSCNFFGPYQYPEKLISLFVTNLIEGKKVPLYGKGENVREWIFTEDHCRAVDVILHKGEPGEVYNIGTGQRKKNIEIAKLILEGLDKGEEMIEYVKDRPGHDLRYAVDFSKLQQELGWEPKVKFEDGIKRTIEWYKKNEAWWKKIKSGEYLEYYKKQYDSTS